MRGDRCRACGRRGCPARRRRRSCCCCASLRIVVVLSRRPGACAGAAGDPGGRVVMAHAALHGDDLREPEADPPVEHAARAARVLRARSRFRRAPRRRGASRWHEEPAADVRHRGGRSACSSRLASSSTTTRTSPSDEGAPDARGGDRRSAGRRTAAARERLSACARGCSTSGHSRGTFLTASSATRSRPRDGRRCGVIGWIAGFARAGPLARDRARRPPGRWPCWPFAPASSGLGAERWLFFAEARHTVRLYHGDRTTYEPTP